MVKQKEELSQPATNSHITDSISVLINKTEKQSQQQIDKIKFNKDSSNYLKTYE
jgi:hypothetical protein